MSCSFKKDESYLKEIKEFNSRATVDGINTCP
jgi:hypothetical protein